MSYRIAIIDKNKSYDKQALKVFADILNKELLNPKWSILVNDIGKQSRFWSEIIKPKSKRCKYKNWVKAILEYVRTKIMYQPDPPVEKFSLPTAILNRGFGDCDDFSIVLAILFMTLNLPIRIVLAGYRKKGNNIPMTHIYVKVKVKNEWLTCDGTVKNKGFWHEKPFLKRKMFRIKGSKIILSKIDKRY